MAIFAAAAIPVSGTKDEHIKDMLQYIEEAAKKNVDLILFPEYALGITEGDPDVPPDTISAKSMHYLWEISELVPEGKSVQLFIEKAKKHNIYICWSMGERDPDRFDVLYNTAVLVGPEGFVGKYRKTHLVKTEKVMVYAGCEYPVFDTRIGKIGMLICYDLNYPEVSRILMLKGAQVLLCPALWPADGTLNEDDKGDYHRWDIMGQARALENMMPVLTCSVAGYYDPNDPEKGMTVGHGRIINACGTILASTGWEPGMVVAEVDIVKDTLEARFDNMSMANMIRDRRPDLYGEITRIHKHCMMIGGMVE